MTSHDGFIGQLEDYLETFDGETPLPERVRDALHAELPRTRQVHARPGPRGVFRMGNVPARFSGVIAAAVVVAVIAVGAVLMDGNSAQVGSQPSASPSPSPSASPSPSPSASPSPSPALLHLDAAWSSVCPGMSSVGCVAPGTYSMSALPGAWTVTVPAGWIEWGPGQDTEGLLVQRPDVPNGSGWGVVITPIGSVARDPCSATAGSLPPGNVTSVARLIAAMTAWPGFQVSAPQTARIGSIPGEVVEVTSTKSTEGCGRPVIWTTPTGQPIDAYPMVNDQGIAYPARFTIIQLEGGQLVAVRAMGSAMTSPNEVSQGIAMDPQRHVADQTTLQTIIDSIRVTQRPG